MSLASDHSILNLLTAFLAGVISFLSPCVLPLVPGYISFISGISLEELSKGADRKDLYRRSLTGAVCFVLGFGLVFTLLGASATAVGNFLADYRLIIGKIAGAVIVLFGLHLSGALPIKWLYYEKRFSSSSVSSGALGAFVMGLAFAFGWTPCIGPVLAGILALAAQQETIGQGVALLAAYSLGLGLPFIATALSINAFLQFFNKYKKFIRWGEIFAGLLLVFVGSLIFTNRLTMLIGYLPEWMIRFAL